MPYFLSTIGSLWNLPAWHTAGAQNYHLLNKSGCKQESLIYSESWCVLNLPSVGRQGGDGRETSNQPVPKRLLGSQARQADTERERDRGQSRRNEGSELKRLWMEIKGPGLQDPGTSQHGGRCCLPCPASLREKPPQREQMLSASPGGKPHAHTRQPVSKVSTCLGKASL